MKKFVIKKKKLFIIVAIAVVVVCIGVLGYFIVKSSPPSGNLLKSYSYIQGDFDTSKVHGLNKAYMEKVNMKFGKQVSKHNKIKVVSTTINTPNMEVIINNAVNSVAGNIDNSNYQEKLKLVQTELESQLRLDCVLTEKTVNITLVKEGFKWKIVPNEEFSNAIDGNMANILKSKLLQLNGGK